MSSSSDISSEAAEYVDSIMSSQRLTRVDTANATPIRASCKRNLSVSGTSDTSAKKARNISDPVSSNDTAKIKRSLYDSSISPRKIIVTNADVHVDANPSIQQLIARLSSDMHMMFTSLTERMEKLETGLE